MSFINRKSKLFLTAGQNKTLVPVRSEARLKNYFSTIDARAWSDIEEERRQYILEYAAKNKEGFCLDKYIPLEIIFNAMLAGKNIEINRLQKKMGCLEIIIDNFSKIELTEAQQRQITELILEIEKMYGKLDCLQNIEIGSIIYLSGNGVEMDATNQNPKKINLSTNTIDNEADELSPSDSTVYGNVTRCGIKDFECECMQRELDLLKSKSKEAEELKLERDRLQVERESLLLKCKYLENAAQERDMYKQKYDKILTECECEIVEAQVADRDLAREKDALVEQADDLQTTYIYEQEEEIKPLAMQVDNYTRNKDEVQILKIEKMYGKLDSPQSTERGSIIFPSGNGVEMDATSQISKEINLSTNTIGNEANELKNSDATIYGDVICCDIKDFECECMKRELNQKSKEAEKLKLERDRLQVERESLLLKCKCLENAAQERDMYKQKYGKILTTECECEIVEAEVVARNLARERDALVKQVGDLQTCICEQEKEIKTLAMQVDNLTGNKDEVQHIMWIVNLLGLMHNINLDEFMNSLDGVEIGNIVCNIDEYKKHILKIEKILEIEKNHGKLDRLQSTERESIIYRSGNGVEMDATSQISKEINLSSEEAEKLKLERDRLQVERESLLLKCKCLENIAQERDMYKQKYDNILTTESECEIVKAQVAAKDVARERDALVKQVGDLQTCICKQEEEIKTLAMQVVTFTRNKEEVQSRIKDALSTVWEEVEKKDHLIAASEEKLTSIQAQMKSLNIQCVCKTTFLKIRVEELERELEKSHLEIDELRGQHIENHNDTSLKGPKQFRRSKCDSLTSMKRELEAAQVENKKLHQIANNMVALTGDKHIKKAQSKCAVKSAGDELGKQYRECDGLRSIKGKGDFAGDGGNEINRFENKNLSTPQSREKLKEQLDKSQREKENLEKLVQQIQNDKMSCRSQQQLKRLRIDYAKLQEDLQREMKRRKELENKLNI